MSAPIIVVNMMETAFNQYLRMDPNTVRELAQLKGCVIALEITGFDWEIFLCPTENGLQCLPSSEVEADTRLIGTPLALLGLAVSGDSQAKLASGEVKIKGDVQLGQQFKQILNRMEIDWEEHLSRISGDVFAHQAGRFGRAGIQFFNDVATSLNLDLSEYLQEEIRLLPSEIEVQNYLDEVDHLRSDADRLQARFDHLVRNLGNKT